MFRLSPLLIHPKSGSKNAITLHNNKKYVHIFKHNLLTRSEVKLNETVINT